MEKNNYKYVVSIETFIVDNIAFTNEENDYYSKEDYDVVEFIGDNLLEARNNAFQTANLLRDFFEDEVQQLEYPTGKYGDYPENEEVKEWMHYQIKVYLVNGENEQLCIFDDGDNWTFEGEERESCFKDSIEEHKIYKQLNIDISKIEQSVTYIDNKLNEKKEAKILPNDIDWSNMSIGVKKIDLSLLRKPKDNKRIQIHKDITDLIEKWRNINNN